MCAGRHYSYLVLFPALAAAFLLLQVTDIPATPKSLAATLGEFAVKEAFHARASPHQTSRRASVPDGTTGRCKGRAELRRPLHNRPMGLRHKLYASGSG